MLVSEKIEVAKGFIAFHQVADFADIHDIEVKPKYRVQGYGTQLMMLFLTEMKRRGVKEITLEVRIDNEAAIQLYKKFGFEQVSVRKGYYKGIDGLLMKLTL